MKHSRIVTRPPQPKPPPEVESEAYRRLATAVIAQAHWDLGDPDYRPSAVRFMKAENPFLRFWASIADVDPDKLDIEAVSYRRRPARRRQRRRRSQDGKT